MSFETEQRPLQPGINEPMVGRGNALSELLSVVARAERTGMPHAVSLVGGAGLGKTRLLDAFCGDLLATTSSTGGGRALFRTRCLPTGGPFASIRRLLMARFGLADNMDKADARARFEATLAEVFADQPIGEIARFLGTYAGVHLPETPLERAVEMEPMEHALIGRSALKRFVEADGGGKTTVWVIDDAQLARPETLELLAHVVRRVSGQPFVLVLAGRHELQRQAEALRSLPEERHTAIQLSPLSDADAVRLLRYLLAPADEIPQAIFDACVKMGHGNPYLLKRVVEVLDGQGVVRRRVQDGTVRMQVELERLRFAHLDFSVEEAVDARISRLTPASRALLSHAAVVGEVFWPEALVSLDRRLGDATAPELWGGTQSAELHITESLERLSAQDYLIKLPASPVDGRETYAFAHIAERERLYETMAPERQREIHEAVAEWLENQVADAPERHAETLGYHFERAGVPERAAHYYLLAGQTARRRFANDKAAELLTRTLELMGPGRAHARLTALHALGDVQQLRGETEKAREAFVAMRALAFQVNHRGKGGAAHNRLGRLYRSIGDLEQAMRHLGTGHALFAAEQDERGIAASLDDVARVHWMRGKPDAAERFANQALAIRKSLNDERSIAVSLNNLGLIAQECGREEEAERRFREAIGIRRELGDLPGLAQSTNHLASLHVRRAAYDEAIEMYREALRLCERTGDRMYEALILANLSECAYLKGEHGEALSLLARAETISADIGDRILEGEVSRNLAQAHLAMGDATTAKRHIDRAITLFEEAKSHGWLGMALRTLGRVCAAMGQGEEEVTAAREAFLRASRLFDEMGNEVELRATLETTVSFLEGLTGRDGDHDLAQELSALRKRIETLKSKRVSSGITQEVELAGLQRASADEDEVRTPQDARRKSDRASARPSAEDDEDVVASSPPPRK